MELFSKKTVYCERNTVLTVRKADRQKDKGLYRIRLTCEGGNYEATGYVNVLDVPSKPRNFKPDEVKNIYLLNSNIHILIFTKNEKCHNLHNIFFILVIKIFFQNH